MSELRVERRGPARHRHAGAGGQAQRADPRHARRARGGGGRARSATTRCRVVHPDRRGRQGLLRRRRHRRLGCARPAGVRPALGRRGAPGLRPLGAAAPAGDRHAQRHRVRRRAGARGDGRLPPRRGACAGRPARDARSASCPAGPARSGWSAGRARRAVKRLVLTGEPVDAAEALRLGLVDEVVPDGRRAWTRARALAATMAQRAPVAVQTAKHMVNAAEGEEGVGRDRDAGRCPGRDHGRRARGRGGLPGEACSPVSRAGSSDERSTSLDAAIALDYRQRAMQPRRAAACTHAANSPPQRHREKSAC